MRNSSLHYALLAVCAVALIAGVHATMDHATTMAAVYVAAVVQSTYSERITGAIAGMIGNEIPSEIDTCICETAAGVGFGLAVGQGTDDKGAILGGAAATAFRGVSVRDITLVNSTVDKYAQYQNMAVVTKGDIWVTVDGDVVKGNNVTFESTTGKLGTVAADGTHFLVAGARWMTTAASGTTGLLRLSGELPVT